jgi:hypothetical protein
VSFTGKNARTEFLDLLERHIHRADSEGLLRSCLISSGGLENILKNFANRRGERAALFKYAIPIRLSEIETGSKWSDLVIPAHDAVNEAKIREAVDLSSSSFLDTLRRNGFSKLHPFILRVQQHHAVFSDNFERLAEALRVGYLQSSIPSLVDSASVEALVSRAATLASGKSIAASSSSSSTSGSDVDGVVDEEDDMMEVDPRPPNFNGAFSFVVDFMRNVRATSPAASDKNSATKLARFLAVKADSEVSTFVTPKIFDALMDPVGNHDALIEAATHFASTKVRNGRWMVPRTITDKFVILLPTVAASTPEVPRPVSTHLIVNEEMSVGMVLEPPSDLVPEEPKEGRRKLRRIEETPDDDGAETGSSRRNPVLNFNDCIATSRSGRRLRSNQLFTGDSYDMGA